jgi:gliding motility-associated-like protein
MRVSHVIFLIICLYSHGAKGNALAACDKCKGGLSSITLQYNGSVPRMIRIQDADDEYVNNMMKPGDIVKIDAKDSNDKFDGKSLFIFQNFIMHATIGVDCDADVFVGAVFGNFTILAAESRQGGPLCCGNNNVDNVPPVIAGCPGEITVDVTPGTCRAVVVWQPPTATDNCQLASLVSTHNPGDSFSPGKTTITYTATDGSGNKTTCSFPVIVKDAIYPTWTNCPVTITAKASADGTARVMWTPPQALDNCGIPSVTSTHKPNDLFTTGDTPVTYHATDAAGNSAPCTFIVRVQQHEVVPIELINITKIVTPNGDGVDDGWEIQHIERYPENIVTVMDRWGHVLFKATGYNNDDRQWKGTNKQDQPAPAGTYFFTIEITGSVKTGFLELIR